MSKPHDHDTKHSAHLTRAWSIAALVSTFTAFASQSVHAAGSDGTTLGLPSWVFVLVAIVGLLAVIFWPKNKGTKTTISKELLKPTPQKPTAQKPTPQKPVTPAKPEAPKAPEPVVAKKPDVVAPTPVAPAPAAVVVPTPAPEPVAPTPAPAPEPAPLDALVEAKQFIAQNRVPQAVGILSKGLQREPERTDLMLELLTIYSKQNHHEAFDDMFDQLALLDDPIALIQAEELRDQLIPIVAEEDKRGIIEYEKTAAPVVPETAAEPEAPAVEIEHDTLAFTLDEPAEKQVVVAEDFDLSGFDTDHSFELDKIEATPVAEQAKSLDFTLGEDLVAPAAVEPAVDHSKDLEFKLPEAKPEPVAAPAVAEKKVEDSGLVDLEFDLDDSFSLDDDRTAVETAKSQEWTTDLTGEDFAPSKSATPAAAAPAPAAKPAADANPLLASLDEEFSFLHDVDPQETCLELAKSYISLGEHDSARELLEQVAEQGTAGQKTEASALIAKLAS
jgi:pilus assembly protein FimV